VFAEDAKRIVKMDLENICLENVQACILVGNICLADSNPDAESLYFGRSGHSESFPFSVSRRRRDSLAIHFVPY
jgi:hypothetical protein